MNTRHKFPLAALRAFETAARCGRFIDAAEELGVTHGAISKHISQLEDFLGTPLFEGNRNRRVLTEEGRRFAASLTDAFDRINDAVDVISRRDAMVLDVACLSTLAMRWLIPRLSGFSDRYPQYDVRLTTDDRRIKRSVDVEILVVAPEIQMPPSCEFLFEERLGLAFSASLQGEHGDNRSLAFELPRLATQTRPQAWLEWARLVDAPPEDARPARKMFDHYHLTIEACLNGLGAMIVPLHLVTEEIKSGKLVAPWGFLDSGYRYAIWAERPNHRKNRAFIDWLQTLAGS